MKNPKPTTKWERFKEAWAIVRYDLFIWAVKADSAAILANGTFSLLVIAILAYGARWIVLNGFWLVPWVLALIAVFYVSIFISVLISKAWFRHKLNKGDYNK